MWFLKLIFIVINVKYLKTPKFNSGFFFCPKLWSGKQCRPWRDCSFDLGPHYLLWTIYHNNYIFRQFFSVTITFRWTAWKVPLSKRVGRKTLRNWVINVRWLVVFGFTALRNSIPVHKVRRLPKKNVGWMVVLGFNDLLRQYFSLYRAVFQRRRKKWWTRVKMSKQPPPAPTASTVGPCPTISQISRTPRHWKSTQHHRTTRHPRKEKCKIG